MALKYEIIASKNNTQCRFGFPKPPLNQTYEDTNDRVHVKRNAQSDCINQYNPFLPSALRATMDIQICYDRQVEVYLSIKYLSKSDTHVNITSSTTADHFASRKVGIVEAIYDLLGYHKHQNSRKVLYIDTTMPHLEQRKQLKSLEQLNQLEPNSTDIYTRTQVEKYYDPWP
ncbi:hypothetical protein BD770DRAFT_438399 [Pilaira anomala]|nr:hypothetical protein BD770DRAFT_438399 [Pilaira anomala]